MTPPDPTNPSPDVEALINALYPVEGQLWISVGAARLAIANWLRTQTHDPAANSREERLREATEKAAAKFEEYALSHFKKQTAEGDEKALTNATMASELRAVLKSTEEG